MIHILQHLSSRLVPKGNGGFSLHNTNQICSNNVPDGQQKAARIAGGLIGNKLRIT